MKPPRLELMAAEKGRLAYAKECGRWELIHWIKTHFARPVRKEKPGGT